MAANQVTHTTGADHGTAERLMALAALYREGQTSALIDRAVNKMLAYEAERCRAQLIQLRADLAEFEQRYGLASGDFYARYQAGQTDDRMDFVEWASLAQMAGHLERRLRLLGGEDEGHEVTA
jgi:hypothetical protein